MKEWSRFSNVKQKFQEPAVKLAETPDHLAAANLLLRLRRKHTYERDLPQINVDRSQYKMITSRASLNVRYAETDMMGVVYHGSYLPWLEIGRTTLLKEHGLPYRQLETEGFFLPVLEVGMRYLCPAKYDDTIIVTTVLKDKPTLRIRMEYELHRGDELLATGFTLHAFIDRSGKPVRPPAAFAGVMERLFAK